MPVCEILETFANGQKVVATLTLDGDTVTGTAIDGYKILLDDILDDRIPTYEGGYLTREDDGAEWFYSLPIQYSGSMLRANIIDDDDGEEDDDATSRTDAMQDQDREVFSKGEHVEVTADGEI